MKFITVLVGILLTAHLVSGQVTLSIDTGHKSDNHKIFTTVEQVPEFPGGYQAFYKYLSKNIRYPDVARLIGINGKLVLSFVVDENGYVTHVTPKNCIGAGCDAEAIRLLEASPAWKPGIQDGKLVKVSYEVPISFKIEDGKVYLKDLKKSAYGFIFNIKGVLYTLNEAEAIIGKSFMSDRVQIAEPFYNYNNIPKFEMPDKKEVYLIILKSS